MDNEINSEIYNELASLGPAVEGPVFQDVVGELMQTPEMKAAGEAADAIKEKILAQKAAEKEAREAHALLTANVKENAPVIIEGATGQLIDVSTNSAAARRNEVEEITEAQRQKMIQYEEDKAFFEAQILSRSRKVGEIRDDFIKLLHPYYRSKFIKGLEDYGTMAAALRYMKDIHGITVRKDVLRRMRDTIPVFDAEIEDALAMYQGKLQMEMHRRAVEGTKRGVYFNGECIAEETVYSDALLAKMVDVHTPEYKEAKTKSNERGNTINVQIIKDFHNYKKD